MPSHKKLSMLARRLDLFRGLGPKEVGEVFAKGMTLRLAMGETVVRKGSRGDLMYVIIEGRVKVCDNGKDIAVLETGAMFGEMAMVSNKSRSATVVAVEPTIVFALSEKSFDTLLTKHVSVRLLLNIIRTLSDRLRDANERLERE